jgi:hypothetical protein
MHEYSMPSKSSANTERLIPAHTSCPQKQYSKQQFELWQQQQQTQDVLRRRDAAAQRLAAMQQQVQQLSTSNQARRSHVDGMSRQLTKTCNDVLSTELPRVLRYHELTLTHVRAQLAREQKHRLRELQEIFPLRINAVSQVSSSRYRRRVACAA